MVFFGGLGGATKSMCKTVDIGPSTKGAFKRNLVFQDTLSGSMIISEGGVGFL